MLQRIVEGTYAFPDGLRPSASCVALLSRMIEKDPEKRANLQEIQEHPWFQNKLPPGVITMNDKLVKAAPTQVSHRAVFRSVRLGNRKLDGGIANALPDNTRKSCCRVQTLNDVSLIDVPLIIVSSSRGPSNWICL